MNVNRTAWSVFLTMYSSVRTKKNKSLQINFGTPVYPLNPVKSLANPNHEERVTNVVLATFL